MRWLALGLVALAAREARAESAKWQVEVLHDRGPFTRGSRLGLRWKREPAQLGAVLVLRRPVASAAGLGPHPVRAVDRPGPALIPAFLYPTRAGEYHPAFDAKAHAIPPGTRLGEWVVVASVDGDPADPVNDDVEPGATYEYALVPATRDDRPDTYSGFGDAIATGAETAEIGWFWQRRWAQLAAIAAAAIGAAAWLVLKRRSTRQPD